MKNKDVIPQKPFCPQCGSSQIIPVIFGLVEPKQYLNWEFLPEEKELADAIERGEVDNPGCVPDSYMNAEGLTPHKVCKECDFYFDFRSTL